MHNEDIHILCLVSDVIMVTKTGGIRLLRHERCKLKLTIYNIVFCFSTALRPNFGFGLLIHEVSRSHTTTHHIQ